MNTKVEEAFKALDEMHDTLQSAGSYSGEGYYFHNGQAELEAKDYTAARTTLAAHIAQQDATIARLRLMALRAIGDHHAPHDCYATGPMTGDPIADLVECPACSLIAALNQENANGT